MRSVRLSLVSPPVLGNIKRWLLYLVDLCGGVGTVGPFHVDDGEARARGPLLHHPGHLHVLGQGSLLVALLAECAPEVALLRVAVGQRHQVAREGSAEGRLAHHTTQHPQHGRAWKIVHWVKFLFETSCFNFIAILSCSFLSLVVIRIAD